MEKYPITLNYKEKQFLERVIISKTSSSKAKRKAKVIILRSQHTKISTIVEKTGLSKRTIINYIKDYNSATSKAFFLHYVGKYRRSKLNDYTDIIKNEYNNNHPTTYKEASIRIEQLTGLKRSETQIRYFLNKLGIRSINSSLSGLDYNEVRKFKTAKKKYQESKKLITED